MDSSVAVAVGALAVVIGAGVGVVGTLITERIRARHERTHFLIQERIDAHADYLVALNRAALAAEASAWDRGTPEWAHVNPDVNGRPDNPPDRQEAFDAIQGEVLERVGLLAEMPAASAALRAQNAAVTFLRSAGGITLLSASDTARLTQEQQKLGSQAKARLLARLAIADYRAAAREDVGFKPRGQGLRQRVGKQRPGGGREPS